MEFINTYMLNDPEKRLIPMERKAFYDEQFALSVNGQEPNRSVDVVQVLLFTLDGEVILQKRSQNKAHNPGLIDKSIGWHISVGDTADRTVMVETVQELDVPSIVVNQSDNFERYYFLLKNYLSTIAIVKFIDCQTDKFIRLYQWWELALNNRYHLYFGIYSGKLRNNDQEAKGVLLYSIDELEAEMKQRPEIFTNDLHYFFDKYKSQILSFLSILKS
jgi:isopentenyldiphosphate isomerase